MPPAPGASSGPSCFMAGFAHPTSIVRGSLRAPASYTRHRRRDRRPYGRDLRRSNAQDLPRPARTTTATSARLLSRSANREVLSRKSGGDGRGVHVRGWLLPPQPRRSRRRVIRTCLLPVTLLADALQARGLRCIAPERLPRKRSVAGRAVTPRIRLDPPARDPNAAITPHPHKISLAREGLDTARYRTSGGLKTQVRWRVRLSLPPFCCRFDNMLWLPSGESTLGQASRHHSRCHG